MTANRAKSRHRNRVPGTRARGKRYPIGYIHAKVRNRMVADPDVTRVTLARELGVSQSAIDYHWNRILAEGLVRHSAPDHDARPPRPPSVTTARARVIAAALQWKSQRDQRIAYGLRDIELDRAVTELVDAMRWAEEERSRREAGSA